ncbi:MAG TPA: hypothetical protein VLS90_06185, partial [Thermodesulfobacteriota bacterium]|nr:hypothetical protein [Thermodesulfobacteriota bacterium]
RKFALEHMTRNDLCSLTREAEDVSGIPYVMELDEEEANTILSGNGVAKEASEGNGKDAHVLQLA